MTQAVLTPQTRVAGQTGGRRLYWKQLLPTASISYQGRRLDFTPEYLTDLSRAFEDRAFDMVPAVLADSDNRHNMSPQNMRGELRRTEVRPDGLWGLIDLTADAAQLVDAHPTLGVSVRIVEDHTRADGKAWPRALQHVLLTADPRVTGMAQWQAAVDLATDQTPVLDLSAATYTPPGAPVPQLSEKEQRVLDSLLAKSGAAPATSAAPVTPAVTLAPVPAPAAELTDEEVNALVDEFVGQLEATPAGRHEAPAVVGAHETPAPVTPAAPAVTPEPALAGAALSNSGGGEAARIAALEMSVARSGWQSERANWVAAGVPPVLLDRAEVLLSTPASGQVDLANGQTVDPFAVLRQVLDGAKGLVDLSVAAGTGRDHTVPTGAELTVDQVRESAVYKNWSI